MSTRKPLRVSGLIADGKVVVDESRVDPVDFHAKTARGVHLVEASNAPTKIPLALIDDSPYQPRMECDSAEIDLLSRSLAAAGLDEPIKVRPKENGRYERVSGHRRSRAAHNLGWTEIDTYIVELTDAQAKLAARVANVGRVDLTDWELAKMYQETLDDGSAKNQTDLAHLFSTTQSLVSMRMAMLKLPSTYTAMLNQAPSMFSATCAGTIAKLLQEYPAETELIEAAVRRINDGADQNSVKPWVQQMVKAKTKIDQPKDKAVITDKAGRPMFTAKFEGREIAIMIKAPEIDAKEVEEMVLAALRQRAEKSSDDIIKV